MENEIHSRKISSEHNKRMGGITPSLKKPIKEFFIGHYQNLSIYCQGFLHFLTPSKYQERRKPMGLLQNLGELLMNPIISLILAANIIKAIIKR